MIAASTFLAEAARSLGAREVRVVPFGVAIPADVGPPAEPPHVLYAGRLSEEKGILEFLEATEGLPRVIVGDGPCASHVPEAVGFVSPAKIGAYYERAAVVCVPSRREGYGFSAREAMAYGRPVVATRVGGLLDAVVPDVDRAVCVAGELRGATRLLPRRQLNCAAAWAEARASTHEALSLQPSRPPNWPARTVRCCRPPSPEVPDARRTMAG